MRIRIDSRVTIPLPPLSDPARTGQAVRPVLGRLIPGMGPDIPSPLATTASYSRAGRLIPSMWPDIPCPGRWPLVPRPELCSRAPLPGPPHLPNARALAAPIAAEAA